MLGSYDSQTMCYRGDSLTVNIFSQAGEIAWWNYFDPLLQILAYSWVLYAHLSVVTKKSCSEILRILALFKCHVNV